MTPWRPRAERCGKRTSKPPSKIQQVPSTAGDVASTAAYLPGTAFNAAEGVAHEVTHGVPDNCCNGTLAEKALNAADGLAPMEYFADLKK